MTSVAQRGRDVVDIASVQGRRVRGAYGCDETTSHSRLTATGAIRLIKKQGRIDRGKRALYVVAITFFLLPATSPGRP